MASDCVCIVLDCVVQLTVLDVHGLHTVVHFFFSKLIIHNFLQAHAFVVQKCNQAVIVSPVADNMVTSLPVVVEVKVMKDHIVWRAHFQLQVQGNIDIT